MYRIELILVSKLSLVSFVQTYSQFNFQLYSLSVNLVFTLLSFLLGIQVYHLFGLFWIGNWILGLGQCALAGAFATNYWTFDKKVYIRVYALTQM